jgi:hypothetical protein
VVDDEAGAPEAFGQSLGKIGIILDLKWSELPGCSGKGCNAPRLLHSEMPGAPMRTRGGDNTLPLWLPTSGVALFWLAEACIDLPV